MMFNDGGTTAVAVPRRGMSRRAKLLAAAGLGLGIAGGGYLARNTAPMRAASGFVSKHGSAAKDFAVRQGGAGWSKVKSAGSWGLGKAQAGLGAVRNKFRRSGA